MQLVSWMIYLSLLTNGVLTLDPSSVYLARDGKVALSMDLSFGPASAQTQEAYSTFDLNAGGVIFSIPVSSFQFDNPIIEDQFKKVYMEVDQFPKTTFVGKIKDSIDLTSTEPQHLIVDGILEMHGKSLRTTLPATVQVTEGQIQVYSEFSIRANDYGMNIPMEFFTHEKDEIIVSMELAYTSPESLATKESVKEDD